METGVIMADLYVDSQALTDFAGQLRGLLADFSAPIVTSFGAGCDGSVFDELTSLSSTDGTCGASLNNYLNALAGLADKAAQSAESLDTTLANSVPAQAHAGRSPKETM